MTKKRNLRVTCLLLLFLAVTATFPLCTLAQESSSKTYTLTFDVLQEENRLPVNNATVIITGPVSQSAHSGPDGLAVFNNIPGGVYSVVAYAPNFAIKSSQSLTLTADTTIILLFSQTKAIFDYKPSLINVTTVVTFNASQSTSSGKITGYTWDFGDNTTGVNVTTTHTFAAPGQYSVSLTVTSTVGVATCKQTLTVIKPQEENRIYVFFIFLIPIPFIIFFFYRRSYYVVIQAKLPPDRKHRLCPGDNTECENCDLTPC
jgi:hypothetical protein